MKTLNDMHPTMIRKSTMHRRIIGTTLMVLATSLLLAACGDEQDPINQVEAYALPKTLFVGEWFYSRTVVDTPASDSVAFHNQKGMLERIRWDIQQDYIYARMSYEQVQGAKDISQDSGKYLGEIVGAWRIKSHFDIKRAYNPTTGEELNILRENAEDCKWYDCKYVRVDWSKNWATDYIFLGTGKYIDIAMVKEQMPFSEQDASDPKYKPIFDTKSGYIDVTTAQVIKPGEVFFRYWNISVPICLFFEDMNCESEVIKVRNSFWRRDPNRDYEPRNLRGAKDEWFGLIVKERLNYTTDLGLNYWNKVHYLVRHNLWVKSHKDGTDCVKDDDCKAVGTGSVCDKLLPFHKHDVGTDTDADGLPDAFEATAGLDANSADSDGDGLPDAKDDANANGLRDLDDYYAWDQQNMQFRCTLPPMERDPVPITYFANNFPRSMVCDEHKSDPKKDKDPAPCAAWAYSGDIKAREKNFSSLHFTQADYDDTYFKVILRGAHGWSDGDYLKWIAKHDASQFSGAKAEVLSRFGDAQHGYYTFAICPNNPVVETDPWPCRFPNHSFTQAKDLMAQKYKFNHLTYAQAKAQLAAGAAPTTVSPTWRLGDVRYHMINYINQYSPFRFVGVAMPTATVDPRTGEIISGTANLSSLVDEVTTRSQEKIDLLNGKIKPSDFINGVDLDKWANNINQQTGSKLQRSISPAQLGSMYQSMKQGWMNNIPKLGTPADFEKMKDDQGRPLSNKQLKRALLASFDKSGILDPAKASIDMSALKGTQLEKKLINREVLAAAGFAPGASSMPAKQLTAEMIDKASIARPDFWARLEGERELRERLTNELGMDFAQMVDDGVTAYAKRVKSMAPDQLWAEIRKAYVTLVMSHELGHSVGLQHNFGGSEDAVNFPKEYWQVRTNDFQQDKVCSTSSAIGTDMLCPLFLKPANNYQLGLDAKNIQQGLGGMYEYANTSIMEYHRNWFFHRRLGRYDKAALMFEYADKVEVFKDPGKVPAGLGSEFEPNVFEEWWDSKGSVLMLYNTRAQSYHYTNWYPSMGDKLWLESNRQLVDSKDVVELLSSSGRSKGWYYIKDSTKLVRVPYIYCTRTSSNLGDNCLSHDEGVDQYEKMKTFIDAWDTWYVLSAFPRQRYDVDPWSYRSRAYERFYSRLKDFNNGFALYQSLFYQWYDQKQIDDFFKDPLNGYGPYTVAIQDAFNVAMRAITMPDMKYFGDKLTDLDGQVYYPESEFSTSRSSDLSNSRYFSTEYYDTNYEQTCGYYWWECLHHIGFFIDKMLAMHVLSDSRTYFVGQDTAEDVRKYRISFFNNFSDQIVDIFGGILAHDYKTIAPLYDPSKPSDQTVKDQNGNLWVNRVAWRDYANPSKDVTTTSGAPLQSGTRFTEQLYAAIYGMFRFQGNFDVQFIERGRLWKKGKGTTWSITPTDKVDGVSEFVDPFNGSTYVGISYKDKRGIAQRMLARANMLKARSKYCTQPPPAPAPAPADQCVSVSGADQVKAEQELRDYKDLLDIMVQISAIYDAEGFNWSWNPYNP